MTTTTSDATRRRLDRLSWLLDSAIKVPGLNFRIGLDGLLGLVPVAGDTLTALLSSYIIAEAVRLRVPKRVLLRMGLNTGLDMLLGFIPLVGDIFDFAFKANRKNVQLLSDYVDRPARVRRRSSWQLIGLALLIVAALALVLWLAVALIGLLGSALFG